MKVIASQVAAFIRNRTARRNFRTLLRYIGLLAGLIVVYSVLFHVLMQAEGQEHSWLTGFYWTLTVMSTLGFGDITFHTDLGRIFSIVVLMSGVIFLLIVFPFTFIHFFYQPWLQAQERVRTPRELAAGTGGHVLLVGADPVIPAIIERLRVLARPYVLVVDDVPRALELAEEGIKVMVGPPDDAATWANARVSQASAVIAATDDYLATNIAFTVRELSDKVPITTLARSVDSIDVLELAGANHVVQLTELLGVSLARRAYGGTKRANVVGTVDGLLVAEAPMTHSRLVGRALGECRIPAQTGVSVVGIWERGDFLLPNRDVPLQDSTVLVLAGEPEHLVRFDTLAGCESPERAPILIIGGGRVGRVVARELAARGLDFRVVDNNPARASGCDPARFVLGSAADLAVLERAGIRETPTVVVTTHDDATNVYLTIYCRKLRPDVQLVARANLDRNVSTLHRAGANLVMSYTSLGASIILGLTDARGAMHVAEGLELFKVELPADFTLGTLRQHRLRELTGCNVVSVTPAGKNERSDRLLAPASTTVLEPGDRLVIAGSPAGRRKLQRYLEEGHRALERG